ncbi:MAG: ferredoxin [Caulobacteraceae bacterium]|nr:ferredoxin [Caulobacteraceae bacterium]
MSVEQVIGAVRVRVDRMRCVCSEFCTYIAPNTFETDGEGLVTLLAGSTDSEAAVREAARNCPASAITVEAVEP